MDGSLNNANHQVEVIDNEVRGKKWPDTSPDVLRRLQDIEKLFQQAHAQFLEINRLPTAYNYEIYFDQRLQLLQNLVQESLDCSRDRRKQISVSRSSDRR